MKHNVRTVKLRLIQTLVFPLTAQAHVQLNHAPFVSGPPISGFSAALWISDPWETDDDRLILHSYWNTRALQYVLRTLFPFSNSLLVRIMKVNVSFTYGLYFHWTFLLQSKENDKYSNCWWGLRIIWRPKFVIIIVFVVGLLWYIFVTLSVTGLGHCACYHRLDPNPGRRLP